MVIDKVLIVIREGSPVLAYKYTGFDDPANTVMTRLPSLPSNGHLKEFSACKLTNNTKVIVSGGVDYFEST